MSDVDIFASVPLLRRCHRRVFLGMGKSIDAMGSRSSRSLTHCLDEFPAGYSWVGCSPAVPTCASPANKIMPKQSLGWNRKTSGCLAPRGNPKLKTVKDVPIQTVKDVPILDKHRASWGPRAAVHVLN